MTKKYDKLTKAQLIERLEELEESAPTFTTRVEFSQRGWDEEEEYVRLIEFMKKLTVSGDAPWEDFDV